MEQELYEANLTKEECVALMEKFMGSPINEEKYKKAIEKIAKCATQ